ncbi:hypothetical protein GA0070613_1431 [Micromonospora inositola]|uniref:Uncharacterized protein n=1 Tax=Micromonospora inositola TaxID=47865 RepID=A0A1C5HJN5_9ACTN|nr:hypothetical protein GA0070613_1431 [Micromonospora inositola]
MLIGMSGHVWTPVPRPPSTLRDARSGADPDIRLSATGDYELD